MPSGYWGKLLHINLSKRTFKKIEIEDSLYKKFLSGSGLAARLLYKNYDHTKSPLAEEAPLMFISGLFTGTHIPTACKCSVVGKSPLTGIWAESTVGGYWGERVKSTGYDGFIFTGKSPEPIFLFIGEKNVEFKSANNLWGKDVYETEEYIKSKRDENKIEVACIGPAGERLINISGIMIGGRETRAAGRCGLGAVMGSKNLKAIAVCGKKSPSISNENALKGMLKDFIPGLREKTKGLYDYGTAGGVPSVEANGDLPIQNWKLGSWEEGAEKISGQSIADKVQTGHYACYACPIRCGKDVKLRKGPYRGEEGHGPEYETCAAFGSNILNDDIDYLCAANDLCNRYGLDTISTGNVIALGIECYEEGLIDETDTGGIDLTWGNGEAVLKMINKIISKEDIGAVFAKGVKGAAKIIGGQAEEFAIHTKGLSYAFHDPRAFTSMAANYATANRGACHLEALSYFTESGAFPAELFGFTKEFEAHGFINKGELAAVMQNLMNVFNALGLCKFLIRGEISTEILSLWLNAVTGWNFSESDILITGERLHNIKRMYNVRLGISRKDDMLPSRLLVHDRRTGRAAGSLPHIGKMLSDYYNNRGWSEEGVPSKEKLRELDLVFTLDENG